MRRNSSYLILCFSLRSLSKPTLARSQENFSPRNWRRLRKRGAMDFGDCSQKHAEVRSAQVTTRQLGTPREERQHLPRLGIPRRSSRHKRGRAESKKRPMTPREAMAQRARWAQCPPLPAVPSASWPRRPRVGRNGGRMLYPGAGARPGMR